MGEILLISGVPASGKSYFGQWLEKTASFLHFDVEKDGRLDHRGLKPLWDRCFTNGTVRPTRRSVACICLPHVVLNWGFPPECLNVVALLKSEGVSIWWFNADHAAARRAFIKRDDVSLECFDRQITKMTCAWRNIEALFEPQIITTLGPDDERVSPEDIFRRIQGTKKL